VQDGPENGNLFLGTYYTIQGEDDTYTVGARPIEPQTSLNIHLNGTFARGVLMLGGTFTDSPVDPVISRVITDDIYTKPEPGYEIDSWFPAQVGAINRFISVDGRPRERLIVTPGQFRPALPDGNQQGTQRLYNSLEFEVYHAPYDAQDIIAPTIWQVEVMTDDASITFKSLIQDNSDQIQRVVVLYRAASDNFWTKVELSYDPATDMAMGSVPQVEGSFYYFVQAVDPTGNVAIALENGNPYLAIQGQDHTIYLPTVLKD
jgi:hypothetical protein